tara:strand:- start:1 stop:114 length:114 start_codon:yes stop_codon:yes gene_type:complete
MKHNLKFEEAPPKVSVPSSSELMVKLLEGFRNVELFL